MADTPLAQLDPDAQQALAELGDSLSSLDPEDRQAVAELAQARADGDLSRRGLLKAAGAIGAGALVGGGSAAALTDSAAADASTSDSDPDVGTPSNRADVFAAGVDANVIDTDEIVNVADYIIDSQSDPKNVFQSVSDGETVYIAGEKVTFNGTATTTAEEITVIGNPYRRTQLERSGDFPILKFDGDTSNEPSSRLKYWSFQDLTFSVNENVTGTQPLIQANSCDWFRLTDCTFFLDGNAGAGDGLVMRGCFDWKFSRCWFRRNIDAGSAADLKLKDDPGTETDPHTSNNHHFTDCRWENVASRAIDSDDSGGTSGRNGSLRLSNCKFHGRPNSANRPTEPFITGNMEGLQIVNTQFTWSDSAFIDVTGDYISVAGSEFLREWGTQDSKAAIVLSGEHINVRGNLFQDTPKGPVGIDVSGDYTTVAGNALENHGIEASGTHLAIIGNTISGTDSGSGILVSGAAVNVVGNVVRYADANGIHANGNSRTTITGNVCRNCTDGVLVDGAVRTVVNSNQLDANSDYGIDFSGASNSNLISDNMAIGNTAGGVNSAQAGGATVITDNVT